MQQPLFRSIMNHACSGKEKQRSEFFVNARRVVEPEPRPTMKGIDKAIIMKELGKIVS
jgi:hypothetical protein